MNCTTAVLALMGGAAALTFAAMYFYAQNVAFELKKKVGTYNTALVQLQEERANMIVKTENMFSEHASQQVHLTHLNEEVKILRGVIDRLQTDNKNLAADYKNLQTLLFEENKVNGC